MAKKRATSFDVAKRAGVSRSLVSAVINNTPGIGVSEETREAVLAAIRELNYHVDAQARAMKTGVSRCLAAYGSTRHPLFAQLLEGMQAECEAAGYQILISAPTAGEEGRRKLLSLYHERRIDGIITFDDTSFADEEWAAEAGRADVPYVSVEGYAESESVDSVLTDYYGSVRMALDYIRRTAGTDTEAPLYVEMYAGTSLGNWAERKRREAYADWCREQGLEPRTVQLAARDDPLMADFLKELGEGGAYPVLLFNWSDCVPSFYRAAWAAQLRIGRELRVMAADNTIRGNRLIVPSLSCVEIPYAQMGAEAVRRVLARIAGGEGSVRVPEKAWLDAVLLPGDSL
ncbi:LacI family DNA-binding transcriptional regulator [Gorillibacterium sp. sgz5001074]|uniref:LacI family DNA-binding transcriptional regulator n=1 Tax=Gorillibacterium sp. sgz5001074 TaxID=3446695 RepID=UPI003F66C68B